MVYPFHGILVIIKRSKILINAITWMNLENIKLSERNQSEAKCHIVYNSVYGKYPEWVY